MLFGSCINIVAAACGDKRPIADYIKQSKFDFMEANLTALKQATEEEYKATRAFLDSFGLPVPVSNSMFPKEIRLTAEGVVPQKVKDYLEIAFSRAHEIGIRKAVLGSDKSRQLPDGYSQDKAYEEMIFIVREAVVPMAEKYDITVLIEPLRRPCNFINTLEDGMRVVNGVNHPKVQLLADTIHMITSGEDPKYVHTITDHIRHVHVSDWNRALPQFGYSPELSAVLRELKAAGYADTFSFEANEPKDRFELQRSLLLLKQKLA